MKTIGIFYFSGTGNTELVAEIIRNKFVELECKVDLLRMEDIIKVGLHADPDQYDFLGIGCPVIGFGVPRLVSEFIRDLPSAAGKKTFLFRTAGGVAAVNYHASKPIIRNLSGKGYDVRYERVFSIGSNWKVKYDDDVVRSLYDATKIKAERMCGEVLDEKQRILRTGVCLRLLMGAVRALSSIMLRFMGKDLTSDPSCSRCGLCMKNCPAGNIYERDGKIRFGDSCSNCMRCVYSCPNHAIRFRFLTSFPVEGGYHIAETINGRDCPDLSAIQGQDESGNRRTPSFFSEYIRNIDL